MRNVFQAISYLESEIVSNMLAANGIPATVNRQSVSRTGAVCSEVWVIDDSDVDRAVEVVREYLAKQQSDYEYVGDRAIGIVFQVIGTAALLGAAVYLPVALAESGALRTLATVIPLTAFGAFLFRQGRLARSRSKAAHSVAGGESS